MYFEADIKLLAGKMGISPSALHKNLSKHPPLQNAIRDYYRSIVRDC